MPRRVLCPVCEGPMPEEDASVLRILLKPPVKNGVA